MRLSLFIDPLFVQNDLNMYYYINKVLKNMCVFTVLHKNTSTNKKFQYVWAKFNFLFEGVKNILIIGIISIIAIIFDRTTITPN